MKNIVFAVAAAVLLFSAERAAAACDYGNPQPDETWTATWTSPSGLRTYSIEAPCLVWTFQEFSYTARITLAPSCPDGSLLVAAEWSIVDEAGYYDDPEQLLGWNVIGSQVVAGGDTSWIRVANRQWERVITTTYTQDYWHFLKFVFTDLGGQCSASAMRWSRDTQILGLTVDPLPPWLVANHAPIVDAGADLAIASRDLAAATVSGSASDEDGDALTYRWLTGAFELQPSREVDASGAAPLELDAVGALPVGTYVFTLEVTDGTDVATDTVTVTVGNSPPVTAPFAGGTFQVGQPISLAGAVADFDGGTLVYQWLEGAAVLAEGTAAVSAGGAPTALPVHAAGDLAVGDHLVTLAVWDGVEWTTADASIRVVDTVAPTLAPVASTQILWPPSGGMMPVRIVANTRDAGGGPVRLSASVTTDQPSRNNGRGRVIPDSAVVGIDQVNGIIDVELRAQNGRSEARTYWITVTAVDDFGNASNADVTVVVPHDRRGQ